MSRRLVAWIVVLMLLGAGTAAAQGWAIYNSDPGRFRVDMPGNPKTTTVPVPVGSGQTVPMTEAEVRLRNAVYQASYVDYPERIARAVAVDLLLDKVRDGAGAGQSRQGAGTVRLCPASHRVRRGRHRNIRRGGADCLRRAGGGNHCPAGGA